MSVSAATRPMDNVPPVSPPRAPIAPMASAASIPAAGRVRTQARMMLRATPQRMDRRRPYLPKPEPAHETFFLSPVPFSSFLQRSSTTTAGKTTALGVVLCATPRGLSRLWQAPPTPGSRGVRRGVRRFARRPPFLDQLRRGTQNVLSDDRRSTAGLG